MHEESAGASINIGPWVADLSDLAKFLRDHLVVGFDQVDESVSLDVLLGKLKFANETRISFPEDSVSISWDDLAGLEGLVNEVGDILVSPFVTVLLLELEDVVQALLVSKTVERTSQSIHTSRESKVWVREGRAN